MFVKSKLTVLSYSLDTGLKPVMLRIAYYRTFAKWSVGVKQKKLNFQLLLLLSFERNVLFIFIMESTIDWLLMPSIKAGLRKRVSY